jgi:ABC-type multidrug transport system fused ATPase/permease subunit
MLVLTHLCLVSVLAAIVFGKLLASARNAMNAKIQSRVSKTSTTLSQIKSLKMMGLASESADYIRSLSQAEIKAFQKYRLRLVFLIASGMWRENCTPQFCPFIMQKLMVSTVVLMDILSPVIVVGVSLFSPIWNGVLCPERVFPTLLTMAFITDPLMLVMTGYATISSTAACFIRVQGYLLKPEVFDERIVRPNTPGAAQATAQKIGIHPRTSAVAIGPSGSTAPQLDIVLSDASILSVGDRRQLLSPFSVSCKKSSFTVVLGPTGSGKTTLLRTVLGESHVSSGFVTVAQEQIAYCGQTPWIRNTSVRENIIAERPYDPVWYEVVTGACLLNADLQRLPLGDRSPAGDNGNNLSGGQKHRVVSNSVSTGNSIF